MGIDLSRMGNIEEADDPQDEDTARGQREVKNTLNSGSKGGRLVSPQAERARNSLAERNKSGLDDDAEESRELPDSEYVDYLSTLESDHWWTAKDESGNPVEKGSEMDFPSLDELMMRES